MGKRAAQLVFPLVLSVASLATVADASPGSADVQRAIRALDSDHDSATRAVYALQRGGRTAAVAIRDAWPSLSPLAQKRAIGALRPLAEEHAAAVDALVLGARSDDEAVRELSLATLRKTPERGREGLALLIDDPDVGDRAAALLARNEPQYAIPVLLDAMGDEGGADRPALRDSLAVAVERAERPGRALSAWLERDPSPDAVASAAYGLRALDVSDSLLTAYVHRALEGADSFPTTWRALESSGAAGPDARIDRWVKSQLVVDEPWMLRASAVGAACHGALDSPGGGFHGTRVGRCPGSVCRRRTARGLK